MLVEAPPFYLGWGQGTHIIHFTNCCAAWNAASVNKQRQQSMVVNVDIRVQQYGWDDWVN